MSTVSVGSQAGCDFIKGNASLLLVGFLRSSFLQTGEGASSLPSFLTGDQGVPYSNRRGVGYRHNEEKELIFKYNPDLGRQFQISTRQTLCELYWVQDMLSSEKIGMNTSEIFTLLIKYSLPKAYGRWPKKKKNLKQSHFISISQSLNSLFKHKVKRPFLPKCLKQGQHREWNIKSSMTKTWNSTVSGHL